MLFDKHVYEENFLMHLGQYCVKKICFHKITFIFDKKVKERNILYCSFKAICVYRPRVICCAAS